MVKDRIIIVREQDELVAACCVPFDGAFVREVGKIDLFIATSHTIETTGELYKNLLKEYGDKIQIDMIDPRNHSYLFPRLIKDIFSFKVSPREALKTIFTVRSPSVICNGKIVISGEKQLGMKTLEKLNEIIEEKRKE